MKAEKQSETQDKKLPVPELLCEAQTRTQTDSYWTISAINNYFVKFSEILEIISSQVTILTYSIFS